MLEPVAPPRRRRGRPSTGDPVPIRMNDEERATADLLGNGNAALGVRVALAAARLMGEENIRALVQGPAPKRPERAAAPKIRRRT